MTRFLPAIIAAASVLGTTAHANQLQTAFDLALANDPQLAAAQAQREAEVEIRPQARSLLLPQINLTANIARNDQERNQSGFNSQIGQNTQFQSEQDVDSTFAQLTITQAVFDWAAFRQLRQSHEQVAAAHARYLVAEQGLILRVAEAYFNAVAASDTVTFTIAEKRAVERQLDQAKKRFEVGLSALTDVQEAQARFDLTTADEIEAKRQLRTAREALREITGRYLVLLPGVDGELPLNSPDPANADAWVGRALQSNLDLATSRLTAEVALIEIERREGSLFPTLNLRGTASRSDNEGDGSQSQNNMAAQNVTSESDFTDFGVALVLNWDAFTGLRNRSRIREAKSLFNQQAAQVEQAKRQVERQTRDAYDGVLAGISRVQALRAAVKSSQTALDASEAGFRVGNRTSVDVLNSQRDLFRARRDFARARYDYLINRLRLKQAAGQLTADDLQAIDALLASDAGRNDPPTPAADNKR